MADVGRDGPVGNQASAQLFRLTHCRSVRDRLPFFMMATDLHSELARLIKADFGEVIWRDRVRLQAVVTEVSPLTGHTPLYDAVVGRKLSAVRWLVRLGGRVREGGEDGNPWHAALRMTEPLPTLELLLTSGAMTTIDLNACADELRALERGALHQRVADGARRLYLDACRRIERTPDPPVRTDA